MDLKTKLAEKLAQGGTIGSSDVAEFTAPAKDGKKEISGDVKTPLTDNAKKDPVLKAADDGGAAKALADEGSTTSAIAEPVVITDSDREAFLEAMVSGNRFMLPFELFNGKVKGRFRSRTQIETNASISYLSYECRNEKIVTGIEYSNRLRNMLLAAQVMELNEVGFVELKAPLLRTVNGKDVVEPGWLDQLTYWENQNDGLVNAIYKELQIFERKYWVMVDNAKDQNFWNPAESTSK
jgi:hypothetical protein